VSACQFLTHPAAAVEQDDFVVWASAGLRCLNCISIFLAFFCVKILFGLFCRLKKRLKKMKERLKFEVYIQFNRHSKEQVCDDDTSVGRYIY
jgi:hypothetical protein